MVEKNDKGGKFPVGRMLGIALVVAAVTHVGLRSVQSQQASVDGYNWWNFWRSQEEESTTEPPWNGEGIPPWMQKPSSEFEQPNSYVPSETYGTENVPAVDQPYMMESDGQVPAYNFAPEFTNTMEYLIGDQESSYGNTDIPPIQIIEEPLLCDDIVNREIQNAIAQVVAEYSADQVACYNDSQNANVLSVGPYSAGNANGPRVSISGPIMAATGNCATRNPNLHNVSVHLSRPGVPTRNLIFRTCGVPVTGPSAGGCTPQQACAVTYSQSGTPTGCGCQPIADAQSYANIYAEIIQAHMGGMFQTSNLPQPFNIPVPQYAPINSTPCHLRIKNTPRSNEPPEAPIGCGDENIPHYNLIPGDGGCRGVSEGGQGWFCRSSIFSSVCACSP